MNLTVTFLTGYALSVSRYLSDADPTKVISAKSEILSNSPQIDTATTATLAFPNPRGSAETGPADALTATLNVNFRVPLRFGLFPRWPDMSVHVTGTRGTAELSNFVAPWIYHYITVKSSEQDGGRLRKRTEKRYGDLGWTTYVTFRVFLSLISLTHPNDIGFLCHGIMRVKDFVISWRRS